MVEFSQEMNCKVSYMFKLHSQFFANTALEDARGVASTYSTRNATNILQVRSFLYMPESKMYNDTNNVVISIVQNGNTYYPIETVRGDDQYEGPGMWVTVGYQSLLNYLRLILIVLLKFILSLMRLRLEMQ